MKVIDKGHVYFADSYDGGMYEVINFMKRMGDNYPGNLSTHPGTNNQEIIRILLDRTKYLDTQKPCWINPVCIELGRIWLNLLEWRAAKRHDRKFRWIHQIELVATHSKDGHIRYN